MVSPLERHPIHGLHINDNQQFRLVKQDCHHSNFDRVCNTQQQTGQVTPSLHRSSDGDAGCGTCGRTLYYRFERRRCENAVQPLQGCHGSEINRDCYRKQPARQAPHHTCRVDHRQEPAGNCSSSSSSSSSSFFSMKRRRRPRRTARTLPVVASATCPAMRNTSR
jgi:hypothetical protein